MVRKKIPDLLEPVNEVLYKMYSDILYTAPQPFGQFYYGRVEQF